MSDEKKIGLHPVPSRPGRTSLPPQEEAAFQNWWKTDPSVQSWKRDLLGGSGEKSPDDPRDKFDYRKAWLSGDRPRPNEDDEGRYHWGSVGKDVDHPTYYKQFIPGADTIPKPDSFEKGGASYVLSSGGPVLSTQRTRDEKAQRLMAQALRSKALTGTHYMEGLEKEHPFHEYLEETYKWNKNKPEGYKTLHHRHPSAGGDVDTTTWHDPSRMRDILNKQNLDIPVTDFIDESLDQWYPDGTPKEKAITEAYGSQDWFDQIEGLRSGKVR